MSVLNLLNYVEEQLLLQGEKSRNSRGTCLYRGPQGLKCGIGFLISDEDYSSGIEETEVNCLPSTLIGTIINKFNIRAPLESLIEILVQIQNAHDSSPHSYEEFQSHIKDSFSKLKGQYASL